MLFYIENREDRTGCFIQRIERIEQVSFIQRIERIEQVVLYRE